MTIDINKASLREPPKSILGSLKFLGPGLILSAAIVGSGELIATTTMGAKAGFALIWVILFACLTKVAIQLEYGRHCITHGNSTFAAWNAGGGLRIYGIHWTVHVGLLYLIATLVGLGVVLGGCAQVATYAFPVMGIRGWSLVLTILLGLMVFHGEYKPIEIMAALLNIVFVGAIIFCAFSLQATPYAFGVGDIAEGLSFKIPAGTLAIALSVFGIVGLSPGEIFIYPSWCLEKGYGAYTGARDDTEQWGRRAKGWIRVMTIDALFSLLVYLFATIAFYVLGASVLASRELSDGNELIIQLSGIFTAVLGEQTMILFMIGAFAVLFSTAFANTANYSRMWADYLAACGLIDQNSTVQRRRTIAVFSWIVPGGWALSYLIFQEPIALVVFLGLANSAFLLVVALQAVVYRYWETDARLIPSRFYDFALWVSLIVIGYMGVRSLMQLVEQFQS